MADDDLDLYGDFDMPDSSPPASSDSGLKSGSDDKQIDQAFLNLLGGDQTKKTVDTDTTFMNFMIPEASPSASSSHIPQPTVDSDDDVMDLPDLAMSVGGDHGMVIKQRAPKRQSKMKKREVKLFVSVPQTALPLQPNQSPYRCCVLVARLPWSLTDSDLRKMCQCFGSIRVIRFLENGNTGVSLGLCLVQYLTEEAAKRAVAGLPALDLKPAVQTVSEDLFATMVRGDVPWIDGGESEDVRIKLEKLFGLNKTGALTFSERVERLSRKKPKQQKKRPAAKEEPVLEENWADSLKKLQAKVNKGSPDADGGRAFRYEYNDWGDKRARR